MKALPLLRVLPFLATVSPVLAAPLDFPSASFRVQIGSQATKSPASGAGRPMTIDGQPHAFAGERLNSLMRVTWIISPVPGVGDEYVVTVHHPDEEKPRTYSGVFKGGYLRLVDEKKLLVEIEN
jgi:hypothetical protein